LTTLQKLRVVIPKEEFLERVGFQAEIPLEHKENLSAIIKDVSKAMVTVEFL